MTAPTGYNKRRAAAKQARRKRVAELFAQEKTDEEILEILGPGISISTIRKDRKDMRLLRAHSVPKYDRAQILAEYEGLARLDVDPTRIYETISHKLGCDVATARRVLQSEGKVEKLDRFIPAEHPDLMERARELLSDGMPYGVVAREVGVPYDLLTKRLPGLGVRPEDMGAYRAAKRMEEALL